MHRLTPVEVERRNRIRLSVAAHAYERHNHSFMTDSEYDALSREIDVKVPTGNRKLDRFFRTHFHADTGMWIHKHPERAKLEHLYQKFYKERCS